MSDTRAHLATMHGRATDLHECLHDIIIKLREAETLANKIGQADLALEGEMFEPDHDDLMRDLAQAAQILRSAERNNDLHLGQIIEEQDRFECRN